MRILISHIRQSSLSIFVILFLALAAVAQIKDSKLTVAETPNADVNKAQVNKDIDIDARPTGQNEEMIFSGGRISFDPQLTEEQAKELQQARNKVMVSPAACPGQFPSPIAFSVVGFGDVSGSQDSILYYNRSSDKVITNEGGGWMSPSLFIAPCAGLYVFTVTFVKDAYYNGGTTDDVIMYMVRNGISGDLNAGYAWSGEGAGKRDTGTYTVTYRLAQGDSVQSWTHSDGNYTRHLIEFSFSGYRIAP